MAGPRRVDLTRLRTVGRASVTYADVPIHLSYATKAPKSGTLVLILQGGGWKVFTVR